MKFEDAVGQAILAFYEGRKSFEVVEREDGYFDVTFPKLYFEDFEGWREHEKEAIEYAKGRVLDIGCGAGRHCLYLQKKGLNVLGIDKSPLAVKVCRLREVKNAKLMPIEHIDFKPKSFNTILLLGNNFALFGAPEKARRLLRHFYRITSEDGLIIAEAVDPFGTDNPAQRKHYDLNKKRGKLSGQWRIRIRFKNYASKWFDYLQVSKPEMKEILKGTGWAVKKFIDSDSPAYIAIIRKTTSKQNH